MLVPPVKHWLLVLSLLFAPMAGGQSLHHALEIRLEPAKHRLEVRDEIRLLQDAPERVVFQLHADLDPRLIGGGATLSRVRDSKTGDTAIPAETYRLTLEPGVREFTLSYAGEIHHPVTDLGEEYARSPGFSPGLIGTDGVFLGGASHWLPHFPALPLLSFEMAVHLPEDWRAVSQGERTTRGQSGSDSVEMWVESSPQQEVYLIAARFNEYRRAGAAADAFVFLRQPNESLAGRYLELTGRYIEMYQRLIGPYPYAKFALVENFWETGYGMPSFTLLGPRVVRLPFVPYTSYPHEILHNWWGNGVYVDYASGNWAEGLTSYLADHLLKAQRGTAAEYRRDALQKYADYVSVKEDFPLIEFRGRHNAVTEAVGYGKTLMVFHMLRRRLGDKAFSDGLRRLYADNTFKAAGWPEVIEAFNTVADTPLDAFFDQWISRPGAPGLRLRDVAVTEADSGFRLSAVIEQTQIEPAYALTVPVAVQLQDRELALMHDLTMTGREQTLELELPSRPLQLAVDPVFDLFRRLHREEIPPAISQALGGDHVLVVLPTAAPEPLREAYTQLAQSWQRGRGAQVDLQPDDQIQALPNDRVVWLLGWENRFRPLLNAALGTYEFESDQDTVTVGGKTLTRDTSGAVVVARHPQNPDQALAWVATDNPAAMPGLARKLPHYGKYSYLGFSGDEPENILKGQWPVTASPLSVALTKGPAPALALAPRVPLARAPSGSSR